MLVRSHFDAVTISVPDAPGADELLLALAVTDAGRPHARIGGLAAADAVGEDGLHWPLSMRTLITGIGTIVSGDIDAPIVEGDSVSVVDGRIEAVGRGLNADDADTIIDAKGTTAIPGLIDSHAHPTLGDFTPRQRTMDFIESSLHGGITTMISAGEPCASADPRTWSASRPWRSPSRRRTPAFGPVMA